MVKIRYYFLAATVMFFFSCAGYIPLSPSFKKPIQINSIRIILKALPSKNKQEKKTLPEALTLSQKMGQELTAMLNLDNTVLLRRELELFQAALLAGLRETSGLEISLHRPKRVDLIIPEDGNTSELLLSYPQKDGIDHSLELEAHFTYPTGDDPENPILSQIKFINPTTKLTLKILGINPAGKVFWKEQINYKTQKPIPMNISGSKGITLKEIREADPVMAYLVEGALESRN